MGENGTTNEVELNRLTSGNAFERGSTDTLMATFDNVIGTVKNLQLRSDIKWAGAAWYLEWIQAQPYLNGNPYGEAKTFSFNSWIDNKEWRQR